MRRYHVQITNEAGEVVQSWTYKYRAVAQRKYLEMASFIEKVDHLFITIVEDESDE